MAVSSAGGADDEKVVGEVAGDRNRSLADEKVVADDVLDVRFSLDWPRMR